MKVPIVSYLAKLAINNTMAKIRLFVFIYSNL